MTAIAAPSSRFYLHNPAKKESIINADVRYLSTRYRLPWAPRVHTQTYPKPQV